MTSRRLAVLALALAVVPAPAQARDARLTQRLYNAEEVVRIEGRLGVQASIAFAEDEHIENVAIGDAESWQITPNKRANLLFVKPLAAAARTNLTVVTDRRTYFFDLVASPRGPTPVYALRFTYPAGPKPANGGPGMAPGTGPGMGSGLDPAETATLGGGEVPVDPAALNFAWERKGAGKLIPARLYDDGQSVYASWAPGVPIPAILVLSDKGDEGPVNFAVRGQTIVIDGVPARIILRVGRDRAQLDYKGPGPGPRSDQNGPRSDQNGPRAGRVAPLPAAAQLRPAPAEAPSPVVTPPVTPTVAAAPAAQPRSE